MTNQVTKKDRRFEKALFGLLVSLPAAGCMFYLAKLGADLNQKTLASLFALLGFGIVLACTRMGDLP